MVQKLGFLCGSITTNDELVLLTIKGKWLEVIMHVTKSEFLDFLHSKQVQLFISICIHGKVLIIAHIFPCWLSRRHPVIYPTNGN